MNVYQKDGVWYAPKWAHPSTGVVTPAHSLRTKDRADAEHKFALERAGAVGAALAAIPVARNEYKLRTAIDDYLAHKKRGIAPATFASYEGHAKAILGSLGDWDAEALASADIGKAALAEWVNGEIARLGDRTHTVVKRIEAVLKPALRLAYETGRISRLPIFPSVRSDYKAEGRKKIHFARPQFAALWVELPEVDTIAQQSGRDIAVFPQTWADIAISTGMHDSDLSRFARRDWDRERGLWFRRNSKGAEFYGPEWFPCEPYFTAALERALRRRPMGPDDLWIASATPPQQWMRQRLKWACVRAGVVCKPCAGAFRTDKPRAPLPCVLEGCLQAVPDVLAFRRSLATWLRDAGWEFDEVAKILGNSSGMVREVYAQVPRARFVAAVAKSAPASVEMLGLTAAADASAARRGPRRTREEITVVPAVVNSPNQGG